MKPLQENFTEEESTFLDDISEARARELKKELSPDIHRAEIINRQNVGKNAKECKLVNHKKKDHSYTPHGRREEALVYLTDEEDYEYVYEPSTCKLEKSLDWRQLPWFYKDFYLARVHKLLRDVRRKKH